MSLPRGLAGATLVLFATSAQTAPPEFTPYRPLYPGLYLDAAFESDPGDRRFDASGQRRDSALAAPLASSELPRQALALRMAWTFPLFEQEAWPWISSRLHTARLTFSYAELESNGAIASLIDTRADVQRSGGGLGDVTAEFGTFLSGSRDWREGRTGSLATLLLLGLSIPVGVYDREAPTNAGSNHLAAHVKVGAHGTPWHGAFLDAGVGYRVHGSNEEPQFGALAPAEPGDAWLWDVQLAQRLRPGLYLAISASGSEGEANGYRDPRFTTVATSAPPLSDVVPVPGRYADEGTDARLARLALRWFVTERVAAALYWTHPFAGRSGEFDLPLQQRTPAGCAGGTLGCLSVPAGSVRQEGYGEAQSLAADRVGLSLTWQFGTGSRR